MEKQTTVPGLFRDDSGALINKNNDALLSYKAKKNESRKLKELEEKVDHITSDMSDIKDILLKLLQKNKV